MKVDIHRLLDSYQNISSDRLSHEIISQCTVSIERNGTVYVTVNCKKNILRVFFRDILDILVVLYTMEQDKEVLEGKRGTPLPPHPIMGSLTFLQKQNPVSIFLGGFCFFYKSLLTNLATILTMSLQFEIVH